MDNKMIDVICASTINISDARISYSTLHDTKNKIEKLRSDLFEDSTLTKEEKEKAIEKVNEALKKCDDLLENLWEIKKFLEENFDKSLYELKNTK